jgi:hypothetical protein
MENSKNDFEFYMTAYMYELEDKLNNNSEKINSVHFQFDEANTDKELKRFLKNFILEEKRTIETIDCVDEKKVKHSIIKNSFYIDDVLTPDDYSNEVKEEIKKAKANCVYVNPDLIFKISIGGEKLTEYIELKSTKLDRIPGSSIQQISPNEWVIFVKHSDSGIEVITGQYKNTISGTMQFPDRSPRPQVSYVQLKDWIQKYRIVTTNTLVLGEDLLADEKLKLLGDWQQYLSDRWMNILKLKKKNKEPWFNNNLRKFSKELLEYYDSLSDDEKEKFKELIANNIEGEKDE